MIMAFRLAGVNAAAGAAPAAAGTPVFHLHWLGQKRIAAETNAVGFMTVWKLPESQRLETQTLDKLALFLAGVSVTNLPVPTNYQAFVAHSPAASLLRPLLGDVITEECYLEAWPGAGRSTELALAVRLDAPRAALWETNLAGALAARPGARPLPARDHVRAWQLNATNQLALARSGDWTIVDLAPEPAAPLLRDFLARLQGDHPLFPADALHFWLYGEANLGRLAQDLALEWNPPAGWPKASFGLMGDGENVRGRAELNFPKPLPGTLEPWILPTNFVHGALSSFTAIRGLKPWLASTKTWTGLKAGTPPNQYFDWALQGQPVNTFFAAPQPEAGPQVTRLSELILAKNHDWFGDSKIARFTNSASFNGVEWKGLAYLSPFLRSVTSSRDKFVLGGFFPLLGTNYALPPDLRQILAQTNVVAYSWEGTGLRVDQTIFISQFLRLVTQHPQLPRRCAGLAWLRAAGPHLGNCGTLVTQTGPAQLSLVHRSTLGLSSVQLHLLADWLESPQFPHGFFTTLTPKPSLDDPAPGTPPVALPATRK